MQLETEIGKPDIVRERENCWVARLPETFPQGDTPMEQSSPLRLLEDGVELGPAHSFHDTIRDSGTGKFSHWNDRLYFSTSDNSDPRRNGRRYTIVCTQNAERTVAPVTPDLIGHQVALSGFAQLAGFAWTAPVAQFSGEGDTPNAPQQSRLMIYEDGIPLGPAHITHDDIRSLGQGRFSHWGSTLVFSTSDNSSPILNGRRYTAEILEKPAKSRYPETMHLNLTTICNLNCQICRPPDYMKTHKAENLADSYIEHMIADVFPHLKALRIDSSGEPLMSKNFKRVVDAATAHKLPVHIQTNGTFLRQDMVDFFVQSSIRSVCISLDSPRKETLEWIRTGSNYERIMSGVTRLVEARRKAGREQSMTLQFHAAILKQNCEHLNELIELAASLGINGVSLAYGFIHDYMDPDWSVYWNRARVNALFDGAQALAEKKGVFFSPPAQFDLSLSPLEDGYAKMPKDSSRICNYLYHWSYVYPSGKIYPCCVGMYELGDLKKNTFKEIWDGPKYEELRETHTTDKPSYDKCTNCYLRAGWQPNDYRALFGPKHWKYVEEKLSSMADARAPA
jgi:radical SAM protein with 4Fe4S-binding SPASM domain